MRIHLIVDFQYNYYRVKYGFERGKGYRKRLSSIVDGEEIDTTYMYLVLKDIESYREKYRFLSDGTENDVYTSIAADSKSIRKEEDSEYKSNRDNKLDDTDFENISRTLETLKVAGYNIYKKDGMEADDIIRALVMKYENDFDLTIIHTNDSDILVNLSNKVGVARFKSNIKNHILITPYNFSEVMGAEFKCQMPYNCIMLYKCLVGDKSDKIKGVTGFGAARFNKLITYLGDDYNFEGLKDVENVENCLNGLNASSFLTDEQLEEARHSLDLVKFRPVDLKDFEAPIKADTDETRRVAYMKYNMASLVK